MYTPELKLINRDIGIERSEAKKNDEHGKHRNIMYYKITGKQTRSKPRINGFLMSIQDSLRAMHNRYIAKGASFV